MKHPDAPPETLTLAIDHEGESVDVEVYADTDLDQPFYGWCLDTGDRLYFPTPWALDIEVA